MKESDFFRLSKFSELILDRTNTLSFTLVWYLMETYKHKSYRYI